MGLTFKQWLKIHEISVNSNGQDNAATQTAQATSQVAQKWLSNKQNADTQAQLATGGQNPSTLATKLLDAGAQAVQGATPTIATQTTAPAVASFLQNQFQLPNVVKAPAPNKIGMMKKGMKKK